MTIPSDPPGDVVQLVRLERARLVELLRSLSSEDWRRATPCPAWDVLGLVIHLVGNDLGVIARLRDHHHGTPAPDGLDEATFVGWLDDLQIEWVHAARRISPRLAVDLLEWLGRALVDTFAAQDPRSRTARVSWASTSAVPVWFDQARELTEAWIHRQQLREAVGRPSDLGEDLAGPVLDALRWAFPHRLRAEVEGTGSVEIVITEPFRRTWRLVTGDDGWMFAEDAAATPSAVVSLTAEQAWRLLTNNYDTGAHGPIRTSGDAALIEIVLRTRAIIGTPTTT